MCGRVPMSAPVFFFYHADGSSRSQICVVFVRRLECVLAAVVKEKESRASVDGLYSVLLFWVFMHPARCRNVRHKRRVAHHA